MEHLFVQYRSLLREFLGRKADSDEIEKLRKSALGVFSGKFPKTFSGTVLPPKRGDPEERFEWKIVALDQSKIEVEVRFVAPRGIGWKFSALLLWWDAVPDGRPLMAHWLYKGKIRHYPLLDLRRPISVRDLKASIYELCGERLPNQALFDLKQAIAFIEKQRKKGEGSSLSV